MKRVIKIGVGSAAIAATCMLATSAYAESPEHWVQQGRDAIREAKQLHPGKHKAKNIILFIGDGMGVSTVTAARILEGQLKGSAWGGEENALSFETLPYVALSKTYSANQQTPDSAPTMTAMVSGVKTNDGVIGINETVNRRETSWDVIQDNKLVSILAKAEMRGMSTGIISSARITHATPAATYAHTSERNWEYDSQVPAGSDVKDIARQLIEFPYGNGPEVVLGGGRRAFLPSTMADPEDAGSMGRRADGRDLTAEWSASQPASTFVWNKSQFDAIDPYSTSRLLGLFEQSHLEYEADRASDAGGEPSLTDMTEKAIQMLSKNRKGFFLHVESGRIDHAHHAGNAYRALTDTVEFSNAIRKAMEMTDPRETLIIVSADHSHVFTIAGYPKRGNPILGKVVQPGNTNYALAADGKPYTTLAYNNGPGFHVLPVGGDTVYGEPIAAGRAPVDLATVDTEDQGYHQESLIPLASETHAGEDVAIYAGGPGAHLMHGVQEQSYIYYVMEEALGLKHRHHR